MEGRGGGRFIFSFLFLSPSIRFLFFNYKVESREVEPTNNLFETKEQFPFFCFWCLLLADWLPWPWVPPFKGSQPPARRVEQANVLEGLSGLNPSWLNELIYLTSNLSSTTSFNWARQSSAKCYCSLTKRYNLAHFVPIILWNSLIAASVDGLLLEWTNGHMTCYDHLTYYFFFSSSIENHRAAKRTALHIALLCSGIFLRQWAHWLIRN